MRNEIAFAEHHCIFHHETARLRVRFGIPAVLRHAGSQLFHRGKHPRKRPMRIVALVAVMRRFIATAGRHQRRIEIQNVDSGSKHFTDKFTTVHVHAQVRSGTRYKLIRIDFFFHRNRDNQELDVQRIQILLEFYHSRERIVKAILTANFIGNEIVCITAEPEHSVIGPSVLFLREFRKHFLQRITELLCRRRRRATVFESGKRFKTRIRTRIQRAIHRNNFTRSGKRVGNGIRTQLFIGQAERRHFKGYPHRFPHRVSAHHGKRAIRTGILPNRTRSMLFQISIQSRIPIRRKRPRPVHGLFAIHFGSQVVIQDLSRFATRSKLQLTIERSPICPHSGHNLDPPFHLSLIFSRSRNAP